ncbi:hypothetical protein ACFFGH_19960 [Lysobacter korlensis]|uniref:Uncharacterized protein n=1 Tax=Lysobacter korlensis TaxID=553636 RepID=A0ABV6RT12_9GAMM
MFDSPAKREDPGNSSIRRGCGISAGVEVELRARGSGPLTGV